MERDWRDNELYLYGVDLFNAGYWWEAHEVWERLWNLADAHTSESLFLRGLIQLAAARLKLELGENKGAARLATRSRVNLGQVLRSTRERERERERDREPDPSYMGLDLDWLVGIVSHWPPEGLEGERDQERELLLDVKV